MADEIIELLKNKKLCAEVVQTMKDVYSYAGTLYDNPTDDMKEDIDKLGTSLWEEAWWRGEIHAVETVEEHFEEIGDVLKRFL